MKNHFFIGVVLDMFLKVINNGKLKRNISKDYSSLMEEEINLNEIIIGDYAFVCL
ncbi:hypothetical protein [Labilibaculum filiforme]|uniref:hypothetical protein n=1 Tax=Labilibaculum filiforme TaxID=1940526 RepID=UPI0015D5D647|nr:hypothetical protein [Labilibaculum filiforme]